MRGKSISNMPSNHLYTYVPQSVREFDNLRESKRKLSLRTKINFWHAKNRFFPFFGHTIAKNRHSNQSLSSNGFQGVLYLGILAWVCCEQKEAVNNKTCRFCVVSNNQKNFYTIFTPAHISVSISKCVYMCNFPIYSNKKEKYVIPIWTPFSQCFAPNLYTHSLNFDLNSRYLMVNIRAQKNPISFS